MRTIYEAVMKRLKDKVPAIQWVDLDYGQLEQIGTNGRPPVAYPCALVTIDLPKCNSITDTIQSCMANITIRLGFDPLGNGRTAENAPDDVRDKALNPYDVIASVHAAIQGFETKNFNTMSRIRQEKESRREYFIYRMVYACEFEDDTADMG